MPGNSDLTLPGRLGKNTRIPSGILCLIDTAAVKNLPWGISGSHCLTNPKGSVVLVIVINQNNHNIWIQQPLLAADIFWVQHLPWDYGVELHQEGNNIEVAFHPVPLGDIIASMKVVHDEPEQMPSKEASQELCPTFGPLPETKAADFNFKKEVEHLSFKLNLEDVPLDIEHQAKFIDLIYSNQEIFSLHDEDLCYYNQLTHTILTSTN